MQSSLEVLGAFSEASILSHFSSPCYPWHQNVGLPVGSSPISLEGQQLETLHGEGELIHCGSKEKEEIKIEISYRCSA